MNFAVARDQYKKADLAGFNEIENPHQLISITIRELVHSLKFLVVSGTEATELRSRNLTRCFTAIYILQTSLDFEKGGKIAENLYIVYEFCRRHLTLTFNRDISADLSQCIMMLEDILDAWNKIK
ncbi:MAG: flagellar protein FliS [Paracoccaceae bacterium]|jgi:flagellar protein FliS